MIYKFNKIYSFFYYIYTIKMKRKWTNNEPYERSKRLSKLLDEENKQFSKDMETSAYASSLHFDENTWDILNQRGGLPTSNKREELDSKINERNNQYTSKQIVQNPFLEETNYLDGMSIRENYLKQNND